MTRDDKAKATVHENGRRAAIDGKPSTANPYPRVHYGARSQFAGVWHKRWRLGWEEGQRQMKAGGAQ